MQTNLSWETVKSSTCHCQSYPEAQGFSAFPVMLSSKSLKPTCLPMEKIVSFMPPWKNTWDRSNYRKKNVFWLHCMVVQLHCLWALGLNRTCWGRGVWIAYHVRTCETQPLPNREAGLGGRAWKQDRPSTHSFDLRPTCSVARIFP